ncbi:MAG TPA: SIS domain-containing protein [Chloroflexota bacterium]|nr:SIS domain-containing protein [Chloroflexota bacterium]
MAAEIEEQPQILERILTDTLAEIRDVAATIARSNCRFVLFAARGTSDHAALYAKYLVETLLQLPAGLVSPSTTTIYDARPDLRGVMYLAVSQSGGSPDLIEAVTRARECGALTLAVTNAPQSALVECAELSLAIGAGPESAVAATKSYTAELLALYLLVAGLAGRPTDDVTPLPEQARRLLARGHEVAELAIRYRFVDQLVVTARGYNYPTAREAALKLMETSYLVAHAFSGADLLHGPLAMIDRGFPVIALSPAGPGSGALLPVLEQLRRRGADTLVLGDLPALKLATVGMQLPDDVPEALSPILTILPVQQFAWHLAIARGLDPDRPRGLQKVTQTR